MSMPWTCERSSKPETASVMLRMYGICCNFECFPPNFLYVSRTIPPSTFNVSVSIAFICSFTPVLLLACVFTSLASKCSLSDYVFMCVGVSAPALSVTS